MDRRKYPATDQIAHTSLRGKTDITQFTEGVTRRIAVPLADLLRKPNGARERQLWLGEAFTVIDHDQGHAFGFAKKDGYCGWLPDAALTDASEPTHWVATPGTHLYPEPRVQAREHAALPMGACLQVIANRGNFVETTVGFVPAAHMRQIGDWLTDPISVAETFLGTPYLWGGNSRAGIDCSGLAQISFHACGIAVPGDADQQEVVGTALEASTQLRRGDLLFWDGHIAMIVDAARLIHANGHSMSVAYEPIDACIARIIAQNGGPVTQRRRP